MPESHYLQIFEAITQIKIGCSLILVNVKYKTPYVFQVSEEGIVDQVRNFCAIGSGAPNAESWLHYRNVHQFSFLPNTLVAVYEAKKFSEHAPGVGAKTRLVVIAGNRLRILNPAGQLVLDKMWENYGPRQHPKEFLGVLDVQNYIELDWDGGITGE